MDAFKKFEMYIDYKNHYSLKKAISSLSREFDMAVSKKNIHHARTVIYVARQLYDKLSLTYRESEELWETMSYSQRVIAKQLRSLMAYFAKKIQTEFSMGDLKHEIEQTIGTN